MKDIPIFILNKDRLNTLKMFIDSMHKRNYTNITIIDNKSTYEPLLEWYKTSGINVYFNPMPITDNSSLHRLVHEYQIPQFRDVVMNNYYILNDSDIVPIDECPDDFVDVMIKLCFGLKAHKIGLGLKIDDLPDIFYNKQKVLDIETSYLNNPSTGMLEGYPNPITLYRAAVDTTFAVYSPGTACGWGGPNIGAYHTGEKTGPCFRMSNPFMARHLPWYYDYNNLPEDEYYYIKNLQANTGPCWSFWAKDVIK